MWSSTLVLKLDNVEMAVFSAHEMRLRSTAHASNMLHRLDGQASGLSKRGFEEKKGFIGSAQSWARNKIDFMRIRLSACADLGLVASDKILHAIYIDVGKIDHRAA